MTKASQPIRIDGYLTQKKLASALAAIVGDDWLGNELELPNSRRRWDMAFCTDGHTTAVEYDGDAHYRDPLKIKIDNEKDAIASSLGYTFVRIPYWVQLDTETLSHYFGLTAVIDQDFPHGFITTKLFPASYCEMGISRFHRELQSLPTSVYDAVIASLRERAEEHGVEYVLPSALRTLI